MRRLILLVLLTLPVTGAAQDARNPKLEIYKLWNKNVASLGAEGDYESGKWRQLYDKLQSDPPEHVRSLDMERIIEELIKLHKERVGYLERMLQLQKR